MNINLKKAHSEPNVFCKGLSPPKTAAMTGAEFTRSHAKLIPVSNHRQQEQVFKHSVSPPSCSPFTKTLLSSSPHPHHHLLDSSPVLTTFLSDVQSIVAAPCSPSPPSSSLPKTYLYYNINQTYATNTHTETQIIEWISSLTKIKVSKPILDSFKSGVTLCKLVNSIKPGTIKKINFGTAAFSHRENISSFTKGCEAIGFQEDLSRFQEYILEEKEGLVVGSLYNLMKYSEKITNATGGGASGGGGSIASNAYVNSSSSSSSSSSSAASPQLTSVPASPASIPSPILKPSQYMAKRMAVPNNSNSNTSNNGQPPSIATTSTTTAPTLERKSSAEVVAKPILSALSSSSSQLFINNNSNPNNCNNSNNSNNNNVSSTATANTVSKLNNLQNKSKFFNPKPLATTSTCTNNNNNGDESNSPYSTPTTTTPPAVSPRGKKESPPTTVIPPSPSPPKKSIITTTSTTTTTTTTSTPTKPTNKKNDEEILDILDSIASTTLDTPVTEESTSTFSSCSTTTAQEEIEKEQITATTTEYDNAAVETSYTPSTKPSKPPPPPPRNKNIPLSKQLSSGSMTDDTMNSSSDDIQFEFEQSNSSSNNNNNNSSASTLTQPLSPVSDNEDTMDVIESTPSKTVPISIPPPVSSPPVSAPPVSAPSTTTTTTATSSPTPISHSSSVSAHSLTNLAKNKPAPTMNSNYNTISTSSPTTSNHTNNIINNPSMFSPPSSPSNQTSTSPNNHSQQQQTQSATFKKPRSSTKQKLVGFFGNKKSSSSASTSNLHSLNNNNSGSNGNSSNGGSVNISHHHKQSISAGSLLSQSSSASFKSANGSTNGNNRKIGLSSDDDDHIESNLSQSMGSPINNNTTNYYYNINNGNGNQFLPKNNSSNSLTMSKDSNNNANGHPLNNSGNHFDQDEDDDQLNANSEELVRALSQVEFLFKDRKVLKERINYTYPEQYKSFVLYDEILQAETSPTFLTPQLRSMSAKKQLEYCKMEERRYLTEIFTLKNVQNIVDDNKALQIRVEEMQKMIDILIVEKKASAAKFDEMLAIKEQSDAKKIEEEGIIFSEYKGKVEIKGGKTEKLIERLYNKSIHGFVSEYVDTFLLTYRAFTTSKNVMEMLTKTYNENEPLEEVGQDNERQFQIEQENLARKKIRIRIFNFLKRWIELFFNDFDTDLIQEYTQFIGKSKEQNAASILQRTLDKKLNGRSNIKAFSFGNKSPPVPLVPKLPIVSFNDEVDPIEIARQLTLIDSDLFRAINSKELLSLSWQKSDKEKRSPNLLKMIYRFNEVSNWVTLTIVKETNIKRRAHHLKRFIRLTEELRKLNNFNSIFVVVSALHSASVNRLSKTWGEVSKQQLKQFEEFVTLTSPNSSFASYREELHNANPPCIPYLGVHLSDLTFIEEGNPDKLENGFVNFFKCRMVAEVIKEIQQFQQQPYNLTVIPEISGPLTNHKVATESECFKLSLLAEPREQQSVDVVPKK
ncbi:hypothetical protein CYY_008110 [Polysphondylium violaceum]|uniref:Ras guanine nucleotide exchange factor n=1 Tax=Polysphondylium violaceum TaxID=133409 RepID=A0A8J4PNE3_9MYCE|nr:hypothetical protein CYY_008110 [Polysphondylium violaceum]